MPSLYCTATHYFSMSCGEGWDQPMMEAAASGLQLVAPRHSAYIDYLDDSIAHFLPARLQPAEFEGSMAGEDRIFFEGCSWWVPDENAAAATLRGLIDGSLPPTQPAAPRIRERFTWSAATRSLIEILLEI